MTSEPTCEAFAPATQLLIAVRLPFGCRRWQPFATLSDSEQTRIPLKSSTFDPHRLTATRPRPIRIPLGLPEKARFYGLFCLYDRDWPTRRQESGSRGPLRLRQFEEVVDAPGRVVLEIAKNFGVEIACRLDRGVPERIGNG